MDSSVTLVVPSISSRVLDLLPRALESAAAQTVPFTSVIVQRAGPEDDAAATRQAGLEKVTTPWVTFLDDDDELEPDHLEALIETQFATGSDVVYSWFTCCENGKPVPDDSRQLWLAGEPAFGKEWSLTHVEELLAGRWCFHLNALFRTNMIREVGGFHAPGRGMRDTYLSEDLDLEQRLVKSGAIVTHCPRRTWRWHFWDGRTKGQPPT